MGDIANGGTLEFNDSIDTRPKIAINSVQRTLLVERLCVNRYTGGNYVIPYDIDNLYPNKIKSIAQRSGTTISAIETLASFLSGNGFVGMDTIVNRDNQTLWDIVRTVTRSRATFDGYALHFNYNIFGKIAEINPVNFEFVRRSKNLKTIFVNPDWGGRSQRKDEVEYNPFNPANVIAEIKAAGGLEKHKGQILYWIPNAEDLYCPCRFDAVLDDAQFEAEAKLYSLSGIQNDYSLSGIISYPEGITNQKQIDSIQKEVSKDKGAGNAGGIRVVGATLAEGLTNWKWFTPISRNNIDSLHKNQKEDAKFNIYAAFRQPPILNGVATQGMFNQESFADAFNYYNSATESERKDTEKILSWILAQSIWNIKIEIQPKKYNAKQGDILSEAEIDQKAKEVRERAQANLRGTVGGVEGIIKLQEGLKSGAVSVQAATAILTQIYGFTPEIAIQMTGGTLPGQPVPAGEQKVNSTLTNLTGRQLQGVFRITRKFKKGDLTREQAAVMLKDGFGFDDEQINIWLVNDEQDI